MKIKRIIVLAIALVMLATSAAPVLAADYSANASSSTNVASVYQPSTAYTGTLPTRTVKKGSRGKDVKAAQSFLNWCINSNLSVDGYCGNQTKAAIKKFQKQYKSKRLAVDGVFGPKSLKVAREIIADYEEPIQEETPPSEEPVVLPEVTLDQWIDAVETQCNWSIDQVYKWVNPPNVENSRTMGTCISLPTVALQRLGLLPQDGWFYLSLKTGQINGACADFVTSHPETYEVLYPNKTIDQLGDQIKKGDIVAYKGGSGHIMVYMGKDENGNPLFTSMGNKKSHPIGVNVKIPTYAKAKINMIVRIRYH